MQSINKHLCMNIRNSIICIIFTLATVIVSYAATNTPEILPEKTKIINSKAIYLTFDDGPSKTMTDRALGILKKYNIKATFFVIGVNIEGNEGVLKRIYDGGNSIGLHTYTHKYKKIYRSQDEFITEMLKDSFKIRSILGISPTAIRFPGGSPKKLNKDYLEKLHNYNFKVFDWNMALSDGINPNLSTAKLFKQGTKNADKKSRVILLMHCNEENKTTCQVLPKIIEYYQKLNYEFKRIEDDTPEFYWKYKN